VVNMAEREVIVDKYRVTYEGLFSVTELYKLITDWLEEKGYDQKEMKNIESVTENGKYIEIWLQPWKKFTDYAKSIIQLKMFMSDIKEVEVEKSGFKKKLNQGKVQLVFDGFLETDYENRWEMKPTFFLIRTLFDKYFYKPFTGGVQQQVRENMFDLVGRVKAFLNLYKF